MFPDEVLLNPRGDQRRHSHPAFVRITCVREALVSMDLRADFAEENTGAFGSIAAVLA